MTQSKPWCYLPEYEVWTDDDVITKVHSLDFEDAAMEFTYQFDQGDSTICGGETVLTVFVKYNGIVKQFLVTGEMVPSYYAQEIVKPKLN